jgi:hypothetical protein
MKTKKRYIAVALALIAPLYIFSIVMVYLARSM